MHRLFAVALGTTVNEIKFAEIAGKLHNEGLFSRLLAHYQLNLVMRRLPIQAIDGPQQSVVTTYSQESTT